MPPSRRTVTGLILEYGSHSDTKVGKGEVNHMERVRSSTVFHKSNRVDGVLGDED